MEADTHKVHSLPGPVDQRSSQLRQDLELMKEYLLVCVRREDWHGVMDASADIREIVARLSMLAPTPGDGRSTAASSNRPSPDG